MRLALYILPIVGVFIQMLRIAEALKCQTSPDFALLRYGDPLKNLTIDFGAEGGFLYKLSSLILFWKDDASCCTARNMSKIALGSDNQSELRGSLSLLYRFFVMLCMSQSFDTMACALQGKRPVPETGMTLFEHSLAFAECEALISSAVGFGFFGPSRIETNTSSSKSPAMLLSRAEVLQRLNVPPEVLFMCLISCFSHMSSSVLATLGIRHKVRLVNTGVWACCYIGAFFWSFMKAMQTPVEDLADLGILRFPTVCIVGFIPHLLIGIGTVTCATLYGLALFFTALSVPENATEDGSFRQRLAWAYHNLQANVQFSSNPGINFSMSEDFYTTLLKIGFSVLTAASEAVYLNEGSRINVPSSTWLEQKRIDEVAAEIERRRPPVIPAELLGEGIAPGVVSIDHQNFGISLSPYARERRSRPAINARDKPSGGDIDTGLGLTQRRGRTQLTLDFVAAFFWLVVGLWAQLALQLLRKFGSRRRPNYLLKAAGIEDVKPHERPRADYGKAEQKEFWMRRSDGQMFRPNCDNIDVESETRRMWVDSGQPLDEDTLGSKLYSWWKDGGWYGDLDGSGDYEDDHNDDDDDTTSMISMSTNASVHDYDVWLEENGMRTPTQSNPDFDRSRESAVDQDASLDVEELSRLLNPQSAAEREEARLLSYKLRSGRTVTRSQYRRDENRNRIQLLAGLRGLTNTTRSEAEEEWDLEQFILSQRSSKKAKARNSAGATWETGADGMGEGGPQCVVCQCTPRTILVWPCGCLSMCDDCRVGLAARNHTKCICCRTEIAAYSRLYVP